MSELEVRRLETALTVLFLTLSPLAVILYHLALLLRGL